MSTDLITFWNHISSGLRIDPTPTLAILSSTMESAIQDIVSAILSNADITVKAQTIDEPELTEDDKRTFLKDFIESRPASTVLSKYGRYLKDLRHLEYFAQKCKGDPGESYCVEHYIRMLETVNTPKPSIVRNRRFKALQDLLAKNDDHFREHEMMRREPELYEQLIGQYMTEQEKKMRDRCGEENQTFLGALLTGIEMESLRDNQERAVISTRNEVGSDSEDDPEDCIPSGGSLWGEFESDIPAPISAKTHVPKTRVSEQEKEEMKREFIETVYQNFLSGQDSVFDYSAVDSNTDYDDLDMVDKDLQDKYFDEDSME